MTRKPRSHARILIFRTCAILKYERETRSVLCRIAPWDRFNDAIAFFHTQFPQCNSTQQRPFLMHNLKLACDDTRPTLYKWRREVMTLQNRNLWNYGIGWRIQKEQHEKYSIAKNQPVGANWWEDRSTVMLRWLHVNPSKIGQDR